MKQILLATKNPGKILEYQTIFKEFNLPIILVTLKDIGVTADVEEDGKTFEENAIKKVNFYSQFTDLPVLSEDGGLEIDYLNGEPGIYSRRWPSSAEAAAGKPGPEKTDEELLHMLFEKMKDVPADKRGAQFRVALAFKSSRDVEPIISDGILRGRITEGLATLVIPGFPFRSLFYVPSIGKTLGELTMKDESKVAHRRIALTKLIPEIEKIM